MAVALILNPRYEINFHALRVDRGNSLSDRVQNIALPTIFTYGRLFISAFLDSVIMNVRYIVTTFEFLVLGYNGITYHYPEPDLFIQKLFIWIGVHIIGIVLLCGINFYSLIQSLPSKLKNYIHPELYLDHLKCRKSDIDMSKVSENIHVRDILQIFNEINFSDQNLPGYMPESTRNESGTIYTQAELQDSLNTFVNHIENRDAFLGTPPSYALPKLMQFYEQIEKATRFSLDKVERDLNEFLQANEGHLPQPGEAKYNEYNDLLYARSRVALDFAITGKHCGARYMGDAMDTYFGLKGSANEQHLTLRDSLMEFLANEREKIARAHIQTHLGAGTHNFSAYMANLGQLLGIPGTENVVEYLGSFSFNRHTMLQHFFNEYTPDFIRDRVREKINTSQELREKVYDWLKTQANEWKREEYRQLGNDILEEIPQVSSLREDHFENDEINIFLEMIQTIPNIDLSEDDSWGNFLDKVLYCDQAKEFFNNKFANINRFDLMRKKQAIKRICLNPVIAPILQRNLQRGISRVDLEESLRTLEYDKHIQRVLRQNNLPPLDSSVIARIYNEETNLSSVLQNHIARARENEFLDALFEDQNEENYRLSDNLLNWLLIRQGVLQVPIQD